jgi:hypothetical protein
MLHRGKRIILSVKMFQFATKAVKALKRIRLICLGCWRTLVRFADLGLVEIVLVVAPSCWLLLRQKPVALPICRV